MSTLRAARVRWNLLMERRGHRPFRTCPTCGSSLSAEWPYLDPTVLKEHKHNLPCWKSGKAAGCDFCSVVTLVIHHANTQHSLKPLPVDGFQLRRNYNNVDIEVSWGKKFDRFVLTLGYFSDRAQIWFYSFTVHPEKRNRLLGTPYSRLIDRSTPEAINLIRWWMTTCERDHTSCRKTSNGFMPIRLLHIADGMISLQLNVEETKPYMALSHCWGPVKPIMLLKRSLELFQKCIPWADLPRTFREAVALARGLGFEYIWIDTLCIIQDSVSDWEQQSSLMASIYGNAALVLAASVSGSAEDGFLLAPEKKSFSDGSEVFSEACLHLRRNRWSRRNHRFLKVCLEPVRNIRGPLDSRAWAYQEEAMAKRYLSFGSREMMWTCTEAVHFESGGRRYWQRMEEFRPRNLNELFTSITEPTSLRASWRRTVIPMYSSRKLTHQSDILVALSGVAQAFHSGMNSNYLAGLWKEDLIQGLCWYCPEKSSSQQQYCPTWTWASVNGSYIAYFYAGRDSDEHPDLCAAVLEASTSPATINVFGPVSEGLVVVRGPSSMATLILTMTGEVLQLKSEIVDRIQSKFGQKLPRWKMWQDTLLVRTNVTLSDGTMVSSARRVAFEETIQAQDDVEVHGNMTTKAWLMPLRFGVMETWRTLEMLVLGRDMTNPNHFHRLGLLRRVVGNLEEVEIETLREAILQEMGCQEYKII